ncbi:MAG: hypothetical protein Q4P66_07025 [Actinomycetaceae bacterium]|nr:hypothetical protein [Actinomycetaceae bacterium]
MTEPLLHTVTELLCVAGLDYTVFDTPSDTISAFGDGQERGSVLSIVPSDYRDAFQYHNNIQRTLSGPVITVAQRFHGLTSPHDIVLPGDEAALLTRIEMLSAVCSPQEYRCTSIDNPAMATVVSLACADHMSSRFPRHGVTWCQSSLHCYDIDSRLLGSTRLRGGHDNTDHLLTVTQMAALADPNSGDTVLSAHLYERMMREGNRRYVPFGTTRDIAGGHSISLSEKKMKSALQSIRAGALVYSPYIVADDAYFTWEHMQCVAPTTVVVTCDRNERSFKRFTDLLSTVRHCDSKTQPASYVCITYGPGSISKYDFTAFCYDNNIAVGHLPKVSARTVERWLRNPYRLQRIIATLLEQAETLAKGDVSHERL